MTNGGWDFQVRRVDLDGLGIDAGQRLGMVIVQPEYELIPDGVVPFRISEGYREAQKGLIERAFQIRAVESQVRNMPIPLVLFPEAAIPVSDPDGLDCVRQEMQQAEGEIIFMGGLEGLSLQELEGLVNRFRPNAEVGRPDFDAAGAFVNTCVIAVKSDRGELAWHFQAKLAPSQWEQPRSMARGKRLLYFLAPRLAFVCQICFDHVAMQGTEELSLRVCHDLIQNTQPLAAPLNFVFVFQCNPHPQADCVRRNTDLVLNFTDPHLSNHLASVVVVNKAATVQEPSDYGRSGFHYRTGRWQIPISDVGPKGYELYESDHVTSAVFRKRTQAIHVATWVPPSLNIGDPGNPRQPLENPRSYFITEECDLSPCPCLPGDTSAAGAFVLCDCLPCKLRDTLFLNLPARDPRNRWQAYDAVQGESLTAHYEEIRKQILALSCTRAGELLDLLLHAYENRKANPDTWIEPRPGAVVEFMAALSVLREWQQSFDFGTKKELTALLGDLLTVVVLDGEDRKHSWRHLEHAYRKAFEALYFRPEMRQRPVLLVALRSQGEVESGVNSSWIEFTEIRDRGRLGEEKSIAKHERLRFCVCQGSLLEQARLERSIKDFMESKMRCVHG
jgi:hypothetical protein